jgi:hypothetical protein
VRVNASKFIEQNFFCCEGSQSLCHKIFEFVQEADDEDMSSKKPRRKITLIQEEIPIEI